MFRRKNIHLAAFVALIACTLVALFPAALFAAPSQTGTLYIFPHSTLDEHYTSPANGLPENLEGREGISPMRDGVIWVEKVLSYNQADDGSISEWESDTSFVPVKKDITGAMLAFTGLPRGLYIVFEQDLQGSARLDPFVVSMPMEDPVSSGNELWEIYVTPKYVLRPSIEKNQMVSPPGNATPGEKVTWAGNCPSPGTKLYWEIRSEIPVDIADAQRYVVYDLLDERLVCVPSSVQIFIRNRDGKTTALAPGHYENLSTPGELRVAITAQGRTQMLPNALLGAGGETPALYIQFATDVMIVNGEEGLLYNYANLDYVNGFGSDLGNNTNPFDFRDPAEVYIVEIEKLLKEGPATTALAGVQFQLFASEADAKAQKNPISRPGSSEPWIETTDSQGKVYFNGLVDGVYWLAETKVPDGVAEAAPLRIELARDAENVKLYHYRATVYNMREGSGGKTPDGKGDSDQDGKKSARTGDTGTLYRYAGLVLLAFGMLLLLLRDKRKRPSGGYK